MLLDMSNTTDGRTEAVTDSERDARDLPASEDARRSGEWVAGCLETPAVILDWRYATSPFAASMQEARELLAFRRAEQWLGADESPFGSQPSTALLGDNDNSRIRLVK